MPPLHFSSICPSSFHKNFFFFMLCKFSPMPLDTCLLHLLANGQFWSKHFLLPWEFVFDRPLNTAPVSFQAEDGLLGLS